MNVSNDNVIRFNPVAQRRYDYTSVEEVYAAQRQNVGKIHDARGLLVAIGLCLICWGALGYYLVS